MLQTIWYVCCQEPSINVSQEVVDRIAFADRTVVLNSVNVVVVCTNTQFCIEQTGCYELKWRRNNQLLGLSSNQQSTLICPSGDLNNCALERSFIQVSLGRRSVSVGTARYQGVSCAEQCNTVTTSISRVEAVI